MKICVYAISKNEEKFVEKFCNSAKSADMILIADTGSQDGTVNLARKHGAQVFSISINPWRFDKARDAALALIPADIDVCVSLDLDEVLESNWRSVIENTWELGKTTRLRFGYDWGSGIRFQYDKIHGRHGYHWHNPCHETVKSDPRIQEIFAETHELLISHYPDESKSRNQYLGLLQMAVVEDANCSRNAFYYGRELFFNGQWAKAIDEMQRYLALPGANCKNERCYARRVIGACYENMQDENNALINYKLATLENAEIREPWGDLSEFYYHKQQWLECYSSAMAALSIKVRKFTHVCDPAVWSYKLHDLAAISAWHLGWTECAHTHAKNALDLDPQNTRLQNNLKYIEAARTNFQNFLPTT
jgi:glycosyltransferase involved in cell wall biosynthesis